MLKPSPQTPECYGKRWDGTEPACVGGNDPTYTNERGEHRRPPCDFQESCSIRTQAGKQQLVPVSMLNRQQVQPTPPPQAYARPWQAQPQYSQPPTQQHGYQQMVPVNYGMPQYLTVREPMHEKRGKRLFIEIVRSLGKSFGHTLANFFDSEAFTTRPPPRGE
jgi:hypothetical protein